MKFGSVPHPELVDFTLPPDNSETQRVLKTHYNSRGLKVYVGCAKWNRQDLKGFYPRGTKDELTYYSTQFNCIELNATFYNIPSAKQVETWENKTPDDFKFFPKITNSISHYKRLKDVTVLLDEFCTNISVFESKLGMVFLQMHDNFKYKDFDTLVAFIKEFPSEIPLAVELRNKEWFEDPKISSELFNCLEENKITNIVVDTAGRRDMIHMRLTTPTAFVRYVGANYESDYSRLDSWVDRVEQWVKQGLQNLYFFVHQNVEKESPLLSAYFIKKLNKCLGLQLRIPNSPSQPTLGL